MEIEELQQRNLLAARLKTERQRLNLTPEQFAEHGGVHRSSVFNYETGSRVPDALCLLNLHANAGVDVQFVLTGARKQEADGLSKEEQEFISGFLGLPPKPRHVVEQVLLLAEAYAYGDRRARELLSGGAPAIDKGSETHYHGPIKTIAGRDAHKVIHHHAPAVKAKKPKPPKA